MPVMKLAITEIDPFLFNAIRLSLSAIVLGCCVMFENRTRPDAQLSAGQAPSTLKKWLTIVTFSVMAGGLYQILFAIGMDRTTAGNTALIMSSMPMWTAILSFILLKENLGSAWIGLAITFLGTMVVILQKNELDVDSTNLIGNGLVLIAALAWSLGSVVSRPMLKFVSPIRLAFYATLGTLPIHFVMPWIMGSENFHLIWDPVLMTSILYSGIFSTGLAYAMWNYGVQQLGPSHASVFQNMVPLVALIAARFFLSEVITVWQGIGGVLIVFGLFVTRRLRNRDSK